MLGYDFVHYLQVADLQVPYIMMHMRGTPQTMASRENTTYKEGQLASEVGAELQARIDKAICSGIEPWRIITDPGEHCLGTDFDLRDLY